MINKRDLELITILRENSRLSLTEISKKIKMPISTIYEKMKKQNEDIIVKHTTLVDFGAMGFNTRASILIKVDRDERDALKDSLFIHPNVNNIYKINNGFDFMIEALFKNVKDLEDFMEYIEAKYKIVNKTIFYIIEDIKRESFVCDSKNLQLVGI